MDVFRIHELQMSRHSLEHYAYVRTLHPRNSRRKLKPCVLPEEAEQKMLGKVLKDVLHTDVLQLAVSYAAPVCWHALPDSGGRSNQCDGKAVTHIYECISCARKRSFCNHCGDFLVRYENDWCGDCQESICGAAKFPLDSYGKCRRGPCPEQRPVCKKRKAR